MERAEGTARAYIAASNRDDQAAMADMFAEDAAWIPIAGVEPQHGRAAIRERYLTEVKAVNAPIIEDVYVANAGRCVVEFVVDHPERGRVPVVDAVRLVQPRASSG